MRIKYPKNSKYFETFNTLIADNSNVLGTGNDVLLPMSDGYKYQAEEIEVFIDKRKKEFFYTSWWKTQTSLFPARISALVSSLRKKGYDGAWVIKNDPSGINVRKEISFDNQFKSAFSWDTSKGQFGDKLIDRSTVIHSGTGVPREVADFFLVSNENATIPIKLLYNDEKYVCRHEIQNGRYRVFWPTEFAEVISTEFPQLLKIYLSDGKPNQDYWMRFIKTNTPNTYAIKFATHKGDASSRSNTSPSDKSSEEITVTVEQITDYAERHENIDLPTIGGNSSFRVSVGDKGITFHVSTGNDRLHRWNFVRRVADRFNETKSMKVASYGDITVNASYNLALISGVLKELGKFQDIQNKDPFSKTADREELEKKARQIRNIPGRGKAAGNKTPKKVTTQTESYVRDPHVVSDVLDRANGTCELCNKPAPFNKPTGEPFLEVHHVIALAEGGPDIVENAVALCPNCHREAHHGEYAELIKEELG
jgi:hypothetical protein